MCVGACGIFLFNRRREENKGKGGNKKGVCVGGSGSPPALLGLLAFIVSSIRSETSLNLMTMSAFL